MRKGYIVALIVVLFSCSGKDIYNDFQSIPNENWNKQDTLLFNANITDTINGYDVMVHVRNHGSYSFRNLYLFIKTTSPHGYSVQDTVNCILAQPDGQWLGKGWGNIWNTEIPYKKFVRFPVSGVYTIGIVQGMRTDELEGISDIGVQIRKSLNNSGEK